MPIIPVREAIRRHPGATVFRFSDDDPTNAHLLRLVRSGQKTMRCDAVDHYEKREEKVPQIGDLSVALYNHGLPCVVIRTEAVSLLPFDQMSEDLIPPQAEFFDLEDWRARHKADLTQAGVFAPDVMMVVERFEVVELF